MRPRLCSLQVLAVTELARVFELPVLNSTMATDGQVVSRDGASWVQRKQPCLAVLELAPEDARIGDQQQQQGREENAGADDKQQGGQEGEREQPQQQGGEQQGEEHGRQSVSEASVCEGGEAPEVTEADTGELPLLPDAAAPADTNQQQQQHGDKGLAEVEQQPDGLQQTPQQADVLYVACPDKLMECCHQVAAEVSSYISLLAEEAGCCALDVAGLTSLLEKLIMVQV